MRAASVFEVAWDLRSHWLVRTVALACAIAGYAFLSLAPFQWGPPRLIENGAVWTEGGGLALPEPGLVVGRNSPDWLATAARTGHFSLDLRVRPDNVLHWGNILTIGGQGWRDNLVVQQRRQDLVVRVTRACRHIEVFDLPCTTGRKMRGALDPGRWTELSLTIQPGEMTASVDGEVVMERELTDDPLVVWRTGQRLALGNGMDGDWPWRGVFDRAVVRAGDREIDLLDPGLYVTQERFWLFDHSPSVVPFRDAPPKDMLHNIAMYFPFGVLLGLLGLWTGRRGVLYALTATTLVSLTMETTQLFFSDREPSVTDLLLNAAGGTFGFVLVETIRTDPRFERAIRRARRSKLGPRGQTG